jgi:DNA (cytosine-5)-methyltransferase 1
MMTGNPLEVIDVFSGAGGLSLGFHAAGCHIQGAIDLDVVAGQTFLENFSALQPGTPPRVLAGHGYDLEHLDLDAIAGPRPPDILIGGPPCQAFSRLGRGKLDSLSDEGFKGDPRNQLYRRFLEAVRRWKPLAVVMENVPGMLSVAGVNYADEVTSELVELEYRTGYALLNSVWYGVPQFRERLFFIGVRADLGISPPVPPTTHEVALPEGYRPALRHKDQRLPFGGWWELFEGELPVPAVPLPMPAVTVSEALDDLPVLTDHLDGLMLPRGDFRRPLSYRSVPDSEYARRMRHWPGFPEPMSILDHVVRRTPRDYETFRLMKHGDRYPQAVEVARRRLEEELSRLKTEGRAPLLGSQEWDHLKDRFVPPYDEEEFVDKWRKLFPDQPSWTVPAHLARDSYSHIHHNSSQARMISIREAARLQSFPDAFVFRGNMGDCFRQIGNAVPPLLAWAVARAVLEALRGEIAPPITFPSRRVGPRP